MDALFIIVAELLVVPLILWGLIALELTIGLAASLYSVFLGRRSPTDVVIYAWRSVRRRLLWSAIFLTTGLLLADLVFFDTLVALALGSVDEREDLDLSFADAEGSFILGRIELHQLTLNGTRGGADPSARFDVTLDSVVIDVDTAALLSLRFAVEELAVDGVHGRFDRLRASEVRKPEAPSLELSREFRVERLHVGEVELVARDHTREPARELVVELAELDLGPVDSEAAVFDLLYRARGRGSVGGVGFVLTSTTAADGAPQTALEIPTLPLDMLAGPLEQAAGLRASGSAGLSVVNRYVDGPPEPKIDLAVDLQLRELALEPSEGASMGERLMFEVAERALAQLGDDFPLRFEFSILRSELQGARSLAESGIIERVADGIAGALRDKLDESGEGAAPSRPKLFR